MYQIATEAVTAQPALVVRGKTNLKSAGSAIGGAIGTVGTFLRSIAQEPVGAPFTRTLSFENDVLEFETGFPVAAATSGAGEIIATELPKGEVVTTVHLGDQAGSEAAYAALHEWMASNGKNPAGAPWEVYVTDTSMQIFFPIR